MASAYETNRQREAIKKVYNNPTFHKRVNAWAPDQVYAVYRRLTEQGAIK